MFTDTQYLLVKYQKHQRQIYRKQVLNKWWLFTDWYYSKEHFDVLLNILLCLETVNRW